MKPVPASLQFALLWATGRAGYISDYSVSPDTRLHPHGACLKDSVLAACGFNLQFIVSADPSKGVKWILQELCAKHLVGRASLGDSQPRLRLDYTVLNRELARAGLSILPLIYSRYEGEDELVTLSELEQFVLLWSLGKLITPYGERASGNMTFSDLCGVYHYAQRAGAIIGTGEEDYQGRALLNALKRDNLVIKEASFSGRQVYKPDQDVVRGLLIHIRKTEAGNE